MIEAKPPKLVTVWIKTSHFEGSRTSYDWQPYEVEIIRRERNSIVFYSRRRIEGRKPQVSGLYTLRTSSVKFSEPKFNPGMFGPESVAAAKRVTKRRAIMEKHTGEAGELVEAKPGGWLKAKWDNREKPTLIKRSEIKLRRNPKKRNPKIGPYICYECGKGIQRGKEKFSHGLVYHAICEAKAEREAEKELNKVRARNPKQLTYEVTVHGKNVGQVRAFTAQQALLRAARLLGVAKADVRVILVDRNLYGRTNPGGAVAEKIAELVNVGVPHAQAVAMAFKERKNPSKGGAGAGATSSDVRSPTRTSTEVRSPTKTSTSTYARTAGNITVTGGAGAGATTKVVVRRNPKRNPSTREMSERFNGKSSGAVQELKASNRAPRDLARAGKLVFLKLSGKSRQLRIPGAVVCIDPRTEKLWIAGPKVPLLNRRANPGEALDFGEIETICYETSKAHIGGGRKTEYVHEFGEDGGKKPHLHVDVEGMPIISGGEYTIRKEGIVN